MIRPNPVKQTLKEGGNVVGTWVKTADPAVVEVLGLSGFDFFVLDNEHVAMSPESMTQLVRTAELSQIMPIVRVRENRAVEVLQALDSGAMGVQVPQVNSRAEAEQLVKSAKYAPIGERGFAPSHRAAAYGFMDPIEFASASNEHTLVVVYCETVAALQDLDNILKVDGVDVIFIGPFDLSQSLGVIGQPEHQKVQEAVSTIIRKTQEAGRAVGTIAGGADEAQAWFERGVQYVTISSDLGMLAAYGRSQLLRLGWTGTYKPYAPE